MAQISAKIVSQQRASLSSWPEASFFVCLPERTQRLFQEKLKSDSATKWLRQSRLYSLFQAPSYWPQLAVQRSAANLKSENKHPMLVHAGAVYGSEFQTSVLGCQRNYGHIKACR